MSRIDEIAQQFDREIAAGRRVAIALTALAWAAWLAAWLIGGAA